jgi:hypothetical protein
MNTNTPTATRAEFNLNDAVLLLVRKGDVPAGAVGRVLGSFPRLLETSYPVVFIEPKVTVLDLRPDDIVLVDGFHLAAA